MNVTCPHCSFSKSVEPTKVPDRPVKVTCPKCQQAFTFEKPSAEPMEPAAPAPVAAATEATQVTCPACGLAQPEGLSCESCGLVYAKWETRQQQGTNEEASTTARADSPGERIVCQSCGSIQSPASKCNNCGAIIVTTAETVVSTKAGFWIRVVGYLIDGAIVGIVQMVLGTLLGFVLGAMGGASDEAQATISVVSGLLGVAISLGYGVFFIGYCGQTPGKMVLQIKVIRTDGSELGYGRAFLREVVGKFISGILLCIGYLMVAFDSQKQGLHDKIADTYVIKL